jgi:hypothetical protein
MDNRDARISALRRYISLLRHEEERANRLRYSPTAHDFNLASSETQLRTAAQKSLSQEENSGTWRSGDPGAERAQKSKWVAPTRPPTSKSRYEIKPSIRTLSELMCHPGIA